MSGWLGVFDSGVGGLTVAREVVAALPAEDLAYLGDTARVPYGTRSQETVRRYAAGIVRVLAGLGLKALVGACNTASAVALDALRASCSVPVLGVVAPGAARAAERTRTGYVAVLATATTVASSAYSRAIRERDPAIRVTAVPCPLLVPLAEEGWVTGDVPEAVARRYLSPLAGSDVDTLVLGCTHYPLLRPVLHAVATEVLGRPPDIVDSATAVAAALAARLESDGLRSPDGPPGRRRFLVTDALESFSALAPRFLGGPVEDVRLVDVSPAPPAAPPPPPASAPGA